MNEKTRKTGSIKKQTPKTAKRFQRKVTQKRVEEFYKNLGIHSGFRIPVGEFELFKNVNVTETANAGV